MRITCFEAGTHQADNIVGVHAWVLWTSMKTVLQHQYEVYRATSVTHFLNFAEINAKKIFSLYRQLQDGRFAERLASPSPQGLSGSSSPLTVVVHATLWKLQSSLPTKLVWLVQVLGIMTGPIIVLGCIGTFVTFFLPILVGYFLLGEVMIKFWIRALFIEGYLHGILTNLKGSILDAAGALLAENLLMIGVYMFSLFTIVLTFCILSFPWYSSVVAILPRRTRIKSDHHLK
jgi:hypothetical protein